jgi:endo-1,4-beta-D-glucanase Y
MLLAVMRGDTEAHRRFRALRNYTMSRSRMRRPDSEDGLLRWKLNSIDASVVTSQFGNTTAPDGEIYVITALLMAEARGWNTVSIDGSTVNYGSDANALLGALNANFDNYFYTGNNPTTANGPRRYAGLVRFHKDAGYTDPSYANPAFFQYWNEKRPSVNGSRNWGSLVQVHRQLLIDSTSTTGGLGNGLPSEYTDWGGSTTTLNNTNPSASTHAFDAFRVIYNMALDRNWNNNTSHVTNMNRWLTTVGNTNANKPPAQQYMLATAGNGGVDECRVSEYMNSLFLGNNAPGQIAGDYYAGLLGAIATGFLGGRLVKL